MQPSIEARKLISQGKLRDASSLLDRELSKAPQDDDLWYLRGILSLKLNNYENAHECFERALSLKSNPQYHKIIGMAHLEMYEIEDALESFSAAIRLDKKDAETYFYIAVCLILLDDPRCREYVEKAYLQDKKKTREMLLGFCKSFFFVDPSLNENLKKEIGERITSIS